MDTFYSVLKNVGRIESLTIMIVGLILGGLFISKSVTDVEGKIINNPQCTLIFDNKNLYSCKNIKIKYKLYDDDFIEVLEIISSKRLKKGDFFIYEKFNIIKKLLICFGMVILIFSIFFYFLTNNELGNITTGINLLLYTLFLLII